MTLVFDAQAILALLLDEPGGPAVRSRLDAIHDREQEGWIATLNLAEIRYISLREGPEGPRDTVEWLRNIGVQSSSSDAVWELAALIKARYGVPLADTFAMATAAYRGARLVTGTDPDFDVAAELGIEVERVG